MKVLNLRCRHGHVFEGWFAGEEDYARQAESGLLGCPVCDDTEVSRLPSAPRLNLSGARAEAANPPAPKSPALQPKDGAPSEALQAAYLAAARELVRRTEDVGPRFAEEARRIHHGESPARGIRGQATAEERAALADEGIETVQLALPRGIDGPLQ